MAETPICAFPAATTPNSKCGKAVVYGSPETVGLSSAEKIAHSLHAALPSTSATPLFATQLMSPPAIQAMANTIFSHNNFLNSSFNPLAVGSSPEFARVQQWLQHNSPYSSPSPSNTPSLISNLSGLSILSGDSSLTLNSQQLNTTFGKTDETLDPKNQPQKFVQFILETIKNADQDVIIQSLKPLKMFADIVVKRRVEFDQKSVCEVIKILIGQLTMIRELRTINALLDILGILANQYEYEMAILDRKASVFPVFVELLARIAPLALDGNANQTKSLQHLLCLIHRCLSLVKDKSTLRTEQFFTIMLSILRMDSSNSNIKFTSLGILRCLIYGTERWKQFIYDRQIIEIILSLLNKTTYKKIFYQSLRFLNTLLDSKGAKFVTTFIKSGGIEILMQKMANGMVSTEENFVGALNCLKLVSDCIENVPQDLSCAIRFAVTATFPSRGSSEKVYWTNILNALGFLRNATVLNDHARNYLATVDEGQAVKHFAEIVRQCINEINIEHVTDKMSRLKQALLMLDDSLVILAALTKEMADRTLSKGQKNAAKIIANSETIMPIYQYILRMETASTFKYQKSVLMSLCRITKAGAIPALFSQGSNLAETLLNFLFARFDSTDSSKLLLMKMSAEVLYHLIVVPEHHHIEAITPLMSTGVFQPFDLLRSITNDSNLDSDLYLAVLKLIKELCKREPILKSQWSNLTNVHFLSSNSTISSNTEIACLCEEVLEMLHMGEDSSICDIFRLLDS